MNFGSCGRWRNGRLDDHCTMAGTEECDFECPHRDEPSDPQPKESRRRVVVWGSSMANPVVEFTLPTRDGDGVSVPSGKTFSQEDADGGKKG